ncbi:MAG: hypothetical protein WB783_14600 [Arenicellales bacterium]|jgi:hypothetical protein
MKLVRYAVVPALAAMLFSFGAPARADSVGLGFGPGGVYYFDYHAGGGYHRYYEHERHYRRHHYERRHYSYPYYRRGYTYYGFSYPAPARRFYGHEHHNRSYGQRNWSHRGHRDDCDWDDDCD